MFYRILALVALFFLVACGGGHEVQPQAEPGRRAVEQRLPPSEAISQAPEAGQVPLKVVKIGLLVPLSGSSAQVGQSLLDSAILALMDKYGTVDGGDVRSKVVLVPKDTRGTPEGAREAAKYVLNSGAELIVGPLFSQNVDAIKPIAQQYGVNVLTFSNNTAVAGGGVYVFGFLVEQQVERIVNYALNQNMRQVGLLGPRTPYGLSVQDTMTGIMQRSGVQMASNLLYDPMSNAGQEVEQVAMAQAKGSLNALLVPEGGQKLVQIASNLQSKGVTMPNVRLLGPGIWDEPEILRAPALRGGWFASSSPERFAAYERRFRDYYGYAPPRISALAYDAMALSASLALSVSGENFSADAMTDPVGYNGPVNGIFRCQSNGICQRGLAILEVTDYGAKVIDPAPQAFDVPRMY